jgi:DNA-binding HxlR family transcriptional regulator
VTPQSNLPEPGRPVRGSTSGRAIMALLDLLGRRWALRVGWELRDGEPRSFRELQSACDGASSSVLNERLRELRAAGVVGREPGGYRLTSRGAELLELLLPLDAWAQAWAAAGTADAGTSGNTPASRSSSKRLRSSPPP